jgi:MoxR-like ATPase
MDLNLSEIKKAIECAFISDVPLMIWGDPGVGKSSIVKEIADEADVELRDIRLSQVESVDLRGLPSINAGVTIWHIPSFMPTDPDSEGILFLDEINKADPSTQAAAYQLVLDRKLGDYELPPGWRIIAAGNPGPDRITEALANRFAHAYVIANIRNWSIWAKSEGISNDIIGFLNFRPELLAQMPTKQDEHAFPSPRTWEYAARYRTNRLYQLVVSITQY